MSSRKPPVASRRRSVLGEHTEIPLRLLTAPGQAADASQAFGGMGTATLNAFLRVAPPRAAPPGAEPEESQTPQDQAADDVADLFAFADVLDDDDTAQALHVDSVGNYGVYLFRAHAKLGLEHVVAVQRPIGWTAVVLPSADGSTPPRLDHRTDATSCIEITVLAEGQWFAAFDLSTGRHVSFTRDERRDLRAYTGVLNPATLLEGEPWQPSQPPWLLNALEHARQVGGWLPAVDALGARLRAGAQPKLRSLPEILAHGDQLHAWAGERLPLVAAAALQRAAMTAAAELAEQSRRLVPSTASLAAVEENEELDAEFWDGEHLSVKGESLLSELLMKRDRLESLRSVLALVDSDRPIHPALDDADVWLRRAAERGRRAQPPGEAGARLAAVRVTEPNAWWSAR